MTTPQTWPLATLLQRPLSRLRTGRGVERERRSDGRAEALLEASSPLLAGTRWGDREAKCKETRMTSTVGQEVAVRPFRVDVPEEKLVDLRRRIAATRWPDRETVPDRSQGAQLAELQELVRYWGTEYDWRKGEAKLNAWPLIISHGWPGSVFEQIKVIGPLTDPTAFGGRAEDAFDVVIPSLPGFGFSSRPTELGWGLDRIARAWDVLMKRLGYTHYVAQGGDWGGGIVERMGLQAPEGLLGIHTNLAAVFPPDAAAAIDAGAPAPEGLSEKERAAFDDIQRFIQNGGWSYLTMMSSRPQAVGYGLTDSPAGLAAFMLVHGGFRQWTYGKDPDQTPTKDEGLDDISLYWLTITAFPNDDLYRPPETWARRAFPNLVYFSEAERGGHFPAWEEPRLFSEEIRAAFRSLR